MMSAAACAIAIGVFLTYLCRKELVLSWSSHRWPHTIGQISGRNVFTGIYRDMANDGTFAPVDRPFRDVDLVFTYSVAGQSYQSSRFSFASIGWQENTQYYDTGDEVTVYYCPTDPSIAVLQRGPNLSLLAGPTVVALGLGLLVYGLCQH
ncbi:MAG: DUF3592 domain-containing protein [Verrucomicrobiota bacterium]|jgi:hypothetical protein